MSETLQKQNYKQTDVGLIPEDWEVETINKICELTSSKRIFEDDYVSFGIPFYRGKEISSLLENKTINDPYFIAKEKYQSLRLKFGAPKKGDILITAVGTLGNVFLISNNEEFYFKDGNLIWLKNIKGVDKSYLAIQLRNYKIQIIDNAIGSSQKALTINVLNKQLIPLPPTLTEQSAIATALSDVGELQKSLEQLISKKQAIKQGAMQELLTPPHKGGKRLPGFSGEVDFVTLQDSTNCLDYLRIPLNGDQRIQMKGDIPYCGANGIVDYVDDYVIDDDIILIAEDGGNFEDYMERPIAYRMIGKCWVNNHAHILKSKIGFDQGYIFHSLVHKNILDYVRGGTRAKLNKGEMNKIEIYAPKQIEEQKAIAQVLSDMDEEVKALEEKKEKYQKIKGGMMQELLTGKIRLV